MERRYGNYKYLQKSLAEHYDLEYFGGEGADKKSQYLIKEIQCLY